MAGQDKKYDKPEEKPAVGTPDDLAEQAKLPPTLPTSKGGASVVGASSGKTVRLVSVHGGVLINGKLLEQGTEFDVEESDVPSYLTTGTVELVKR